MHCLRSATVLLLSALLLSAPLPAGSSANEPSMGKPPKVSWTPSRVENADISGTTITVELVSDADAPGVTLGTSASLSGLIGVPAGPIDLLADTPVLVDLEVLMTPDEAGRTIGGTVHAFFEGKHLARPLAVSLKQTEPEEEEEEEGEEPEEDDTPSNGNNRGGVLAWSESGNPLYSLTLDLLEGGMTQIEVTPNRTLTNVHLWPTPSLRDCLEVAIASTDNPGSVELSPDGSEILLVTAGEPVLIDVTLLATPEELEDGCGGTIHLRNVGTPRRTWPTPLNVRLGEDEEEGEEVAPAVAVGAASFQLAPISPGQIATIFGEGLCPNENLQPELNENGAVGEQLAGTMVFFDGVPGRMLMCSSSQINVIVPQELSGSEVELLVVRNGFQSTPFPVPVQQVAPELFTLTGEGRGQIAAFNEDGTLNRDTNPALQGSIVIAFGGGVGPTEDGLEDGEIAQAASDLVASVEITVGGVPATVDYAGTSPGQVGALTQFNFQLGAGTPSGQQPVKLSVDGVESTQKATMAVE